MNAQAPYQRVIIVLTCGLLILSAGCIDQSALGGAQPREEVDRTEQAASSNAPMNAPMNAPLNAPLNAPMNAPMNSPMNAPMNSPMNAPLNAPMNAPLNAPLNAPMNAMLVSNTIQVEKAANLVTAAGKAVSDGISLNLGSAFGGSTTVEDFSDYTPTQFERLCEATKIPHTLPTTGPVDLVLPKLVTLKDQFELVKSISNADVTIDIFEGATSVRYRLVRGIGLACADRAYRPLFLSKTAAGTPLTIRSYKDDLSYMCFKHEDPHSCTLNDDKTCPSTCQIVDGSCMVMAGNPTNPNFHQPTYSCGKGKLADGVVGYALRKWTPRPFFLNSLIWQDNTWTRHWEFINAGLGPISEANPQNDGYAYSGWGIDPTVSAAKKKEYLAAIAIKSATNRSGVSISPYNFANRSSTPFKALKTTSLNQCEVGHRNKPDIASKGTLVEGMLIDIGVGPFYQNQNNSCSWQADWNLPSVAVVTTTATDGVTTCDTFDVDAADPAKPVMGVNLADNTEHRCPAWTACPAGKFCCVAAVSTGANAICTQKVDGTVWCWGNGVPDSTGSAWGVSPVQVKKDDDTPLTGVRSVSSGPTHTCAALNDGSVWCWGSNSSGQLGDGTTTTPSGPVRVKSDATTPFWGAMKVFSSNDFTCALRAGSTVFCWGKNNVGQLGNGSTTNSLYATSVRIGSVDLNSVVEVGVGGTFACARRSSGTVKCWGENDDGQLGNLSSANSSQPVDVKTADGAVLYNARSLSTGESHSCVRKEWAPNSNLYNIYCWGRNLGGQLGDGSYTSRQTPVPVTTTDGNPMGSFIEVAAYKAHTCAIRSDHSLWCWGGNFYGQLGIGVVEVGKSYLNPVRVRGPGNVGFVTDALNLSAGPNSDTSCVRLSDGSPHCWGRNSSLQIDGTMSVNDHAPNLVKQPILCGRGGAEDQSPKTSAEVDNFNTTTLHNRWNPVNITDPINNNRVELGGIINKWQSIILKTAEVSDLTDSTSTVELVSIGTAPGSIARFRLGPNGASNLEFRVALGSTLSATRKIGGVTSFLPGSVTYNPTAQRFLRFRESNGTVFMEYAALKAGPWMVLRSEPTPFPIDEVRVELTGYNTTTTNRIVFDNFNVP